MKLVLTLLDLRAELNKAKKKIETQIENERVRLSGDSEDEGVNHMVEKRDAVRPSSVVYMFHSGC